MFVLLLALLAPRASAAEPGFYHPDSIAAQSATYKKAAEGAGETFRTREARAQAVGAALEEYRISLDLLGDRAPAAEREYLANQQKRFNRERAVLEAFASAMLEDFDAQFVAAMKRATPAGAVVCTPTVASGPKMPGLPTKVEKNPACRGPDLSADIAKKMDADATLAKAVNEILTLTWPEVTVQPEPAPATGGATVWIPVSSLHKPLRRGLTTIQREDDEARAPFEAALEDGASKEQLASLVSQARAVDAATAAKRAALASPVLTASERVFARWAKKGDPVGWCARPALLGACTGTAQTSDKIQALYQDKKVATALAR